MKGSFRLIILIVMLLTTGCQKDLPEPEVKVKIVPMSFIHTNHELPVLGGQNSNSFMVQHHVKDDNVYVECIVPNISFREDSKKKGKIILYIDGKRKEEILTAAFIIKGLSSGIHQVKLEVVKPNNEPYHLSREFKVTIP